MVQTPYALIARVTKTHGLHGEVVAVPAGDLTSIDRLEQILMPGLAAFIVPPVSGQGQIHVKAVRRTPKGLLATFNEVTDIETAQEIAGHALLVGRDDIDEELLQDEAVDEFGDGLVGLAVHDEIHGDLGEITEVIITGANDVWVVNGPFGEVLIPVIEQVVLGRDGEGTIIVKLLEGLLPE